MHNFSINTWTINANAYHEVNEQTKITKELLSESEEENKEEESNGKTLVHDSFVYTKVSKYCITDINKKIKV